MISMDDRLKEQIDFILEIDKMKEILRQNYLADGSARENDADHSWHLAMMALILSEYSNEKVDVTRVVPMVLTHDLVEIDAGDTYAYDEAGALTKEKREKAGFSVNICLFLNAGTTLFLLIEVTEIVLIFYFC